MRFGAEDFAQYQFFFLTLFDNLKDHTKINTLNLVSILEDQQKRFMNDFKQKKTDELKMLLDNEMWTQAQVNPFFQNILNKINSIEEFEKQVKSID